MDRRHFSNSFTGGMNRGRHRNRATAEPPYIQTGRSAFTENQPLVHPVNNALRGGYPRTTHWNPETIEYPSSSTMQGSHFQRSFPTPAYDPSSAGNVYLNLTPQENVSLSHPSHYDRYNVNHNPYGPQDSITRSRGPLKRKGVETSANYEIGSSSSRFYGTGSSSRSSELSRRKPSSNMYYGHSEGSYCGNGSVLEDPSRNVRRRSTLDLEDNPMRNHVSSYSSSYIYPPNYPPNNYGDASISHVNFGGTSQNWNLGTTPHAAHGGVRNAGASGLSHGNNQLVRGSGPEIRGYHSDSMPGRGVVPSSQNVHAPCQRARGRRSSHSMRETPSYSVGPSYYSTRWEQVSTEDRHILPSYRHSSQSSRGWGNSYSNGTNGIAAERFRSTASIAHVHGSRFGPEDLMMDSSTFYASSRDFFDQYRDMRLDIDDMSYEELLELEESIGNVNTGLSDDMISLSLIEEAHSLGQYCVEETCSICLEGYENEVKIGTVKNCGHNYHADCIRKWLLMRNVCPICKAPARKD